MSIIKYLKVFQLKKIKDDYLLFLWKMIRQAPKEKKKKLRMKNVEIRCFRLLMANFESKIQENDC